MADTLQAVSWALGMSCTLRSDSAVSNPVQARLATSSAAIYDSFLQSSASEGYGIFEDVCVTSHTTPYVPTWVKRLHPMYPCTGFSIADAFSRTGGAQGLLGMCGVCPANTTGHRAAGCAGSLYRDPESEETEKQLQSIIKRFGLNDDLAQAFPKTKPLWYGLWARSPLSAAAIRVLRVVIGALRDHPPAYMVGENSLSLNEYRRELTDFVAATESAEKHNLPLLVWLRDPGHTDLSIDTTFPHCPFCKAGSRLEPWHYPYPTQAITCHVCQSEYSPAATARSTKSDDFGPELRELLGPERFAAFATSYLMVQGITAPEALEIVKTHEAWVAERAAQAAASHRREQRQKRYAEAVLFEGLHPDYHSEIEGLEGSPAFRADEFAELLERCRRRAIRITFMFHRSQDLKSNKWEFQQIGDPLALFHKWQKKGCREWFGAGFQVPDEILNQFDRAEVVD